MAAEDLDGVAGWGVGLVEGEGGGGETGEGEGGDGEEELHVGWWVVFVPRDGRKKAMSGLLVREGTRLDWTDSNDSSISLEEPTHYCISAHAPFIFPRSRL